MSGTDLLKILRGLEVRLSVDGNRLRIRAPKGALTRELEEEIKALKPELIEILRATTSPADGPSPHRVARGDAIPLSSFQRRLWVLDRLAPSSTAYHLVAWRSFDGVLDKDFIRASLTHLVRQHEILRTNFRVLGGVPKVTIHPPEGMTPPILDWTDPAGGESSARIQELARDEALKPMDLENGALFRPVVVQTSGDSFVLLITLHHIITDAQSLGLILEEWWTTYQALVAGGAPEVLEIPFEYADFAAWQEKVLAEPETQSAESFWRDYLEGAPTVVTLPFDRPRGATQTFEGGTCSLSMEGPVGAKLRKLCREENTTPFIGWLSAFGLLLSRYTGQRDILIGSPVAARTSPMFESTLGPFVNTLVIRYRQERDDTGRTLLTRTKESMLAAHAHQGVPFERLVEIIPDDRTMAHPPLFQVSCAYHNQPGRSDFEITTGGSMFELTLNGFEAGDQLHGSIEYNRALFDEGTAIRLGSHFQTLLNSMVEDPDLPVAELRMIPEVEVPFLVETWDKTPDVPGSSIPFIVAFENQVALNPHRIAVVHGEESLTYFDLNGRADQIAQQLQHLGLNQGDTVAVFLPRGLDMLAAPLAVMKAGGTYVPLDPSYPQARTDYIIEDCGATVILTDEASAELFPESMAQILPIDSLSEPEGPIHSLPGPPDLDGLAYVIYTSGTTGKPKGVEVTHEGLANVLSSLRSTPGLGPDDTAIAVTTFAFDISAVELFLPLSVGARVVISPREIAEHGKKLLELIRETKPSLMQATPATWEMLMDAGWTPETADRKMRVWCGGEALSRTLADALLHRSDSVWNLYGPTETTIWSTVSQVKEGPGPVPIGRPVSNTRVFVLDELRLPTPIGVPGELFIGGHGVANGYRNSPELTEESFSPSFIDFPEAGRLYRTGDQVRWNPSGEMEYLGRLDQQVKVRGHRIELGEIESSLLTHPAIKATAAGVWKSRIVAYVVFVPGQQETPSAIRRFLRDMLPEYMIPGLVVELLELPMTENRKLDRKRLPNPELAGVGPGPSEFEKPKGDREEAIAQIWQGLLGPEVTIGANDNFFELGGHSLLALQAAYRIEELTEKPLDTRAIFFETLRQIAAR